MEKQLNINIFKGYFSDIAKPGFWAGLFVIVLFGIGITLLVYDAMYGLLALAVAVGLPLVWACFYFPKLWIYLIAFSGIAYFKTSAEGVTIADVLTGGLYLGGMAIWFYYVLAIRKEKIIKNYADWFIIFFYIAGIVTIFISIANDVDWLDATKEHLGFSVTLLYFPIRYYINEKRDIIILLVCIALMVIVLDFWQFYGYYKIATHNLIYAYQLGRTVRTNQTLFTSAAIMGLIFFFFTENKKYKIYILIFTALTVAALVSTFSRTFWVVLLFQVFILFFFISFKQKVLLIVLSSVLASFVLLLAFIFMKENTHLLLGTIADRFLSTGRGRQDISVQSRLYEFDVAVARIIENPLGGNGCFKFFQRYNPITMSTDNNPIIHNGYIYLAYRYGIPMSIVYLFFLIYYLLASVRLSLQINDKFYKGLALWGALSLLLIFIADTAASILAYRDGIFVIIYSIFAISKAEDFHRESLNK